MTTELAKTYQPAAVESETYRVWLEEKCFHADPSAPGEPYCIVIPPPNVTGALHLGHAINNTLQDILIRVHRMRGFNTLWVPGIDHAGIATQAVVEKQLREKENLSRHDVGREGLVQRIWQWKQQFGDRIVEQLKRLGCSCDWDRQRFTLDDICARAVRETFFKLFKDGLIHRGKRLVNWDTFLQTSISDDEIYHEKVKTSLWHIKYPIEGAEKSMVVATTRPETMLGDTAVAVHPDDPRWNWAIGKQVRLPLTNRLIPIIADEILVDPKFGTGVVKVTPAHDQNDYATWQRHQGKPDQFDIINILTPDGKINENGGVYASMKRDAARKKVVSDLEHQGLLVKEEPYETEVGHSDRSKTAIEPYLSDQWFVKMAPLAEPALEVVRQGIVKFYPERHAQQYLAWLGEKRDWPISRQLWWGHRIPVWTFTLSVQSDSEWNKKSSEEKEASRSEELSEIRKFFDIAQQSQDVHIIRQSGSNYYHLCVRSDEAEKLVRAIEEMARESRRLMHVQLTPGPSSPRLPAQQIKEYRAEIRDAAYDLHIHQRIHFVRFYRDHSNDAQDPDVLDTWFSSALWPHSTLGWPERTPELAKWYPTSVLLTGRDIITLWVARMVMTGIYNMGEGKFTSASEAEAKEQISDLKSEISKAIPFRSVVINPTILDGKGERMSKSKGNGVDPVDIIDTHGADALRFTVTTMATETQDARLPVRKLADGKNTSEKFDLGRNFCNKLWNAARFVLSSLPEKQAASTPSGMSLADRWIVSRFNRAVHEADEALSAFRFDQYARACYDFFWRDFCDWYVEAAKPALKDPATAAATAQVLAATLDGALRLMHPMIPFITEMIWWRLNETASDRSLPGQIECPPSKRLIHAAWPKPGPFSDADEAAFSRIQLLVSSIRTLRSQHQVEINRSVTVSVLAPAEAAKQILAHRQTVELLATCHLKAVASDLPPNPNAARVTAGDCDIFVEDLIDPQAEQLRLAKRREELTRQIAALQGRLANASYIAKAPPALVQQTRDQLAQSQAELEKIG